MNLRKLSNDERSLFRQFHCPTCDWMGQTVDRPRGRYNRYDFTAGTSAPRCPNGHLVHIVRGKQHRRVCVWAKNSGRVLENRRLTK